MEFLPSTRSPVPSVDVIAAPPFSPLFKITEPPFKLCTPWFFPLNFPPKTSSLELFANMPVSALVTITFFNVTMLSFAPIPNSSDSSLLLLDIVTPSSSFASLLLFKKAAPPPEAVIDPPVILIVLSLFAVSPTTAFSIFVFPCSSIVLLSPAVTTTPKPSSFFADRTTFLTVICPPLPANNAISFAFTFPPVILIMPLSFASRPRLMSKSVPWMVVLSPVNVIILSLPSAVTAAGDSREGTPREEVADPSLVFLFPVTVKFSPVIFPPFSA